MGQLRAVTLGAAASLLLHVSVVAVLSNIEPDAPRTGVVELEFQESHAASTESASGQLGQDDADSTTTRPRPVRVEFGAEATDDNVRNNVRSKSGESSRPKRVTLLIAELATADLRSTPWNATAFSQLQRIRTAAQNSSYENRRATPHPDDAVMLSSGNGQQEDRARRGTNAFGAGTQSETSDSVRATEPAPPTSRDRTGVRTAGGSTPSPAELTQATSRQESSRRLQAATRRPDLDLANASTLATNRARAADNINAANLAATLVESWVDATDRRASGQQDGQGAGGGAGSGTATGRLRVGGNATAYAPGSGQLGALNTESPVFIAWLGEQKRKVSRVLHYPLERALALDQGRTVYRVRLLANGTLASPPHLVRSSGFEDLDEAARQAIEGSAPFSALPAELLQGKPGISVLFPVEFSNPMTR